MKSRMRLLGGAILALVITGCGQEYKEIPAGHVGRVLTATGWQEQVREAGMVDLRDTDMQGRYSVLVLLEATSTTVKEQFLAKGTDSEDHRVLTKNGTPLTVDLYTRALLPENESVRNAIFVQVTPEDTGDSRIKRITIERIYDRFARMDVRGKVRGIFAQYEDYEAVYANYDEINAKIATAVLETFKQNGVPLKLQNAQLSNVKPDETIWAAQNIKVAADAQVVAIDKVGAAYRRNPEYGIAKKWESLIQIVEKGGQNGTNTVIITDGRSGGEEWASAEYLRQRLQPKGSPPKPESEAPPPKGD